MSEKTLNDYVVVRIVITWKQVLEFVEYNNPALIKLYNQLSVNQKASIVAGLKRDLSNTLSIFVEYDHGVAMRRALNQIGFEARLEDAIIKKLPGD